MKWFVNLRIRMKMLISFGLVIALIILLTVIAFTELRAVDDANKYVMDYPMHRKESVLEFQSGARDLRRVVATKLMYAPLNDASMIDALATDSTNAFNACIEALDHYDLRVNEDKKLDQTRKNERLKTSNELRKIITDYKNNVADDVARKARVGDYDAALESVTVSAHLIADLREGILDMIEVSDERVAAERKTATDTVSRIIAIVIAIAAIATVLAIATALYIAGIISKPLVLLSSFMEKAGTTGDIVLRPDDVATIKEYSQFKDEIGQTIGNTAVFINHVANIADELRAVSAGDLTTEAELLSDADVMGVSLAHMIDNLNKLFSEINAASSQVSIGSRQVADGAQSLAQGSTEQAASIQELSRSISEISERTKANAETADKTAKLSETIRADAEKGSRQMDEMMTAVKDISDASQSISKIIKTIDDIAFQTNILALNAAVEAARAGQHGKGFAVVAEEVRNLASKSAEAAKDTGNMIQNSMEKAELGTHIAEETAESLREIVAGINESSQLITEIARASDEQTLGISQIDIGIDQVAQVVQQNSATAEESAAASEEMSGQSDMLLQLIAQFKLRDGDSRYNHYLPSAENYSQRRLGMSEQTGFTHTDSNRDFDKY